MERGWVSLYPPWTQQWLDKYQTSEPMMSSCGFNSHSRRFYFCWNLLKPFDVNFVQKCQMRNLLHTGKKARKWGIHQGFENLGRCHQKSKTEASVATQKRLMSSKNFKKKTGNVRFVLFTQIPDDASRGFRLQHKSGISNISVKNEHWVVL